MPHIQKVNNVLIVSGRPETGLTVLPILVTNKFYCVNRRILKEEKTEVVP